MAAYPRLPALLTSVTALNSEAVFQSRVIPYLADVWLADYEHTAGGGEIVETTVDTFSYLFDISAERLIAAWGISHGKHTAERDRSRMAAHPHSAGPLYHRGHAIPHTLGGPTDINLVPQRSAVNVGAFRQLERRAVASPGALYFTYWVYRSSRTQLPAGVDQGLLIPGQRPEIRTHAN